MTQEAPATKTPTSDTETKNAATKEKLLAVIGDETIE